MTWWLAEVEQKVCSDEQRVTKWNGNTGGLVRKAESFMTYMRHLTEGNRRKLGRAPSTTFLSSFRFLNKQSGCGTLSLNTEEDQLGSQPHSYSSHSKTGSCSLQLLSTIFCKDSSTNRRERAPSPLRTGANNTRTDRPGKTGGKAEKRVKKTEKERSLCLA